jgi:hypothetical protein
MATQPQTTVPIPAPGFLGLNTQDSPVGMPSAFASEADNAVIDDLGRIGSRGGFRAFTAKADLEADFNQRAAERVFEFIDIRGKSWLFITTNEKVFLQEESGGLRDLNAFGAFTSGGIPYGSILWYAAGGNLANIGLPQIVSLDDKCYFFYPQRNALVFDPTSGSGNPVLAVLASAQTPAVGSKWPSAAQTAPATEATLGASVATAGFGRIFAAGFKGIPYFSAPPFYPGFPTAGIDNNSLIVVSSLTDGADLTWDVTIDVSQFWPNGTDVITAMRVHNNYLIVFGQRSILVYGSKTTEGDVYNLELIDTISGIGCIARDSLAFIGTDLIFLDSTGVRSFARTLQEKSLPIGNLSLNVQDNIQQTILSAGPNVGKICAVFNPEESLYTLIFPDSRLTYVFDTRAVLENGSFKATLWPNVGLLCGQRTVARRTFYGAIGGLYEYTGNYDSTFVDVGTPFGDTGVPIVDPADITYHTGVLPVITGVNFRYWTHPQSFDQPARIKMLKQVDMTIVGGQGIDLTLAWRFDYVGAEQQVQITSPSITNSTFNSIPPSQFVGAADYPNLPDKSIAGFFSGTGTLAKSSQENVWGNGRVVAFGFNASVTGAHLSIQELNIQALLGRII